MKKHKKLFSIGLAAFIGLSFMACDDFDDINKNPSAAGSEYVRPDWALNKSFQYAQMNPNDGERVFPYFWASIARYVGDNTTGVTARFNDEFFGCLYSVCSNSLKQTELALQLAEDNKPGNQHDADFYRNVKQFARIWRVCIIGDFVDSFGPYPLEAFTGTNPVFNSVEDVYDFMLSELKDAAANIDLDVLPTESEAAGDIAFGYSPAKWQKLANSLRLKYAMNLSETNPAKAQAEFEDAARGGLLTTVDELFGFQENGGWSDWDGVYNRSWSDHTISSTMVNLLTGLGSTAVTEYRPDLAPQIKPMTYIGEKYDKHFVANTDNPTKQLWMDGIPEYLDPRALVMFNLPNDPTASNYPDQAKQTVDGHANHGMLDPADKNNTLVKIDASLTWNGYPVGTRTAWSPSFEYNTVMTNCAETTPFMGKQYRNNSLQRVWMSPWETYFLLAEGAVRGWNAGISAKQAYENGIRTSFEYQARIVSTLRMSIDLNGFLADYLTSTNYNRVGTSVAFDHVAEPVDFEADYVDGYTKVAAKTTYRYPDASKILYKGHKLNDQLTKIITQKYIANYPYGVVETWNDRRRLGLPFFEIMANESVLTGSDMEGLYSPGDWQNGQKWQMFTQRFRYPTSLQNSDPEQFQSALKLMGATRNTMMEPLPWAIH